MGSEWTIINSIAYLSDSCKKILKLVTLFTWE